MKHTLAFGLLAALTAPGPLFAQCAIGWGMTPAIAIPSSGSDKVIVADVNNDGFRDIIVGSGASGFRDIIVGSGASGFSIFLNNGSPQINLGNAGFPAGVVVPTYTSCYGLAVADFNRDGFVDFAYGSGGNLAVMLGNGTTAPGNPTYFPAGAGLRGSALADVNADSKLDMVFADRTGNTVVVLLGNGDGTFAAPLTTPVGTGPFALAASDVNADGRLDILVLNAQASNNINILYGAGDGTFTAAPSLTSPGTAPAGIAVADFNGDGRADFAVSNTGSNTVSIFRGSASGAFTNIANVAMGLSPTAIAARDFNLDGAIDLVVLNSTAYSFDTARGSGNGQFTSVTRTAANVPYYITAAALGAGDFSGDGRTDVVLAGTGQMVPTFNSPPVPSLTLTGSTCGALAVGATFTQTVSATSVGIPLTYQWRRNGANVSDGGRVSGARSATLRITGVLPSDTGTYTVVVTGCGGATATSASTILATYGDDPCDAQVPEVSMQSPSQSVLVGSSAQLSVAATGTSPLVYQWRRNGANLLNGVVYTGVNTPTLTFQPTGAADGGAFDCVVSNSCGSARSDPRALLAVPVCELDFNHDLLVNPDDLGDFITAYYGAPCP